MKYKILMTMKADGQILEHGKDTWFNSVEEAQIRIGEIIFDGSREKVKQFDIVDPDGKTVQYNERP